MKYWTAITYFEHYLYVALFAVGFVLELWALFHVLAAPKDAFMQANQRTKGFWTAVTGACAFVGGLTLYTTWALGGRSVIFGLAALCVAGVYLAGTRHELAPFLRRRMS